MRAKRILKWSYKSKNMEENCYLGRHSETHAKIVMKLFEAASWFC